MRRLLTLTSVAFCDMNGSGSAFDAAHSGQVYHCPIQSDKSEKTPGGMYDVFEHGHRLLGDMYALRAAFFETDVRKFCRIR